MIDSFRYHYEKYINNLNNKFINACHANNNEYIKKLLNDNEINVNHKTDLGICAFALALANDNIELLKMLINHPSSDINITFGGNTILHHACLNGLKDVVELILVHQNLNINKINEYGKTAFYLACEKGYLDIVETLVKSSHDLNVHIKSYYSVDALQMSCVRGKYDIVKYLLNLDYDINELDQNGMSLMALACNHNNNDIAELLLNQPYIDINNYDKQGWPAVFFACVNDMDIIDKLLERDDLNIMIKTVTGVSLLGLATIHNKVKIIDFINKKSSVK